MATRPVVVVEDDPFTRLIPIVLDPESSEERRAAFADFMSSDEPDFDAWVGRVRAKAGGLYPAEVRMVATETGMRAQLRDCHAVVVESFRVGPDDLAAASHLRVVQKFGAIPRNIDTAACAQKGVKVLTLRRRANISCAEHVFALMLGLARKMGEVGGRVTVERIKAAGVTLKPFDRRHTPGGNFSRVGGLCALNEATIGIIGLGEIGREIAQRAAAFGMHVVYHQRTRLSEDEERPYNARYVSLDELLSQADWVVPQLSTTPVTANMIGLAQFARMKPGARLVNVSSPGLIDRDALIEALRGGRLGGAALDVYYEEPLANDDPILEFDNVLITPHLAGSPRFNGLNDFEDLIAGLAEALAE